VEWLDRFRRGAPKMLCLIGAEVVTVYKHSDGYPDGAVCWITKALEHAWPLPRFEADEFAAAFVAANSGN
jgi:hypothetical protein